MQDARKACDRSSRRRARSIITTDVWCSFSSQTSVSAAKASYASGTYYTPPKSMQRESFFSSPRGCYTRDPCELSNVDSNDGGEAHALFLFACSNNDSGRDMTTSNHAPRKTNPKQNRHISSLSDPMLLSHNFTSSPPRLPAPRLALAPRGAFLFWLNWARWLKHFVSLMKNSPDFSNGFICCPWFQKILLWLFFLFFFFPPENPKKMKICWFWSIFVIFQKNK